MDQATWLGQIGVGGQTNLVLSPIGNAFEVGSIGCLGLSRHTRLNIVLPACSSIEYIKFLITKMVSFSDWPGQKTTALRLELPASDCSILSDIRILP